MAMCVRIPTVLLLLSLGSCGSAGIKLFGGAAQLGLSGTMGLDDSGGGGGFNQIDVDDLGLGGEEISPYGRAEIDLGLIHLTGSGFIFETSGSGTLSQDFGDIPVTTDVNSSLEMLNAKGAISFDIIDLGPLRISPGVAVDYLQIDMNVTSTSGPPASEQLDIDAPVPMLFVQGEVDLGLLNATVDVGWISLDLDDISGTWWDIEGLASFNLFPALELFAGYRYISADVDGTADGQLFDTDLEIQGFTAGLGIVW
jgi:opacity protein-like surface antigen